MTETISRRQILSRSRDAGLDHYNGKLPGNQRFAPYEDYEEMWFSHQHLFKDHIAEVLRKWEQIDDEIWAKMIFMSRNRRIAKAYVRVPALIIDGSDTGFDGYRVGLNGFEDPFRDRHTEQLMARIGKGCRIGIDPRGNILIKRYSEAAVFVRCYPVSLSESCVDQSLARTDGFLEPHQKYVLFDMAKFEAAMMAELRSAYPDRRKLEQQCIVVVGFVRAPTDSILELPVYVMLVNIVALELLKSKLHPVIRHRSVAQRRVPQFVSIFDTAHRSSTPADEPIYGQLAGSDGYYTLGSARPRARIGESEPGPPPPKLPPRDKKKLSEQMSTIKSVRRAPVQIPWPDYQEDDDDDHSTRQWPVPRHNGSRGPATPHNWPFSHGRHTDHQQPQQRPSASLHRGLSARSRRSSSKPPAPAVVEEDPYYSGLEARVTSKKLTRERPPAKGLNWMMRKVLSSNYIPSMFFNTAKRRQKKVPKSRSSNESSTDSDPYVSINDVYEPIYGGGAAWDAQHWPAGRL